VQYRVPYRPCPLCRTVPCRGWFDTVCRQLGSLLSLISWGTWVTYFFWKSCDDELNFVWRGKYFPLVRWKLGGHIYSLLLRWERWGPTFSQVWIERGLLNGYPVMGESPSSRLVLWAFFIGHWWRTYLFSVVNWEWVDEFGEWFISITSPWLLRYGQHIQFSIYPCRLYLVNSISPHVWWFDGATTTRIEWIWGNTLNFIPWSLGLWWRLNCRISFNWVWFNQL